jgi:hypothetical protein
MNGCSDEFPLARIQPQTSICPSSCWVALKSRKAGLFKSRRTERIPFSTTVISEPVRAYGMGDLYCVVAHPTNRTDKAATARVRGLVIALRVGARSRVWEPAKLNKNGYGPLSLYDCGESTVNRSKVRHLAFGSGLLRHTTVPGFD